MRVRVNQAALEEFLRGPTGPVFRQVSSYTRRVSNVAKQRVGVDSGRLRSSITPTVNVDGARVVGRVGSMVSYARYHHDGTGIYGPSNKPIRPKNGSVLVFEARGRGRSRGSKKGLVFATEVQGSKPNPFLVSALEDVVPWPVRHTREG